MLLKTGTMKKRKVNLLLKQKIDAIGKDWIRTWTCNSWSRYFFGWSFVGSSKRCYRHNWPHWRNDISNTRPFIYARGERRSWQQKNKKLPLRLFMCLSRMGNAGSACSGTKIRAESWYCPWLLKAAIWFNFTTDTCFWWVLMKKIAQAAKVVTNTVFKKYRCNRSIKITNRRI